MASFKLPYLLTLFILAIAGSVAIPNSRIEAPPPYNLSRIYQFPLGTWIENIAVRRNGNLLITLINTPELHEINPFSAPYTNSTKLIRHFNGSTYVSGVAEISPDVFAVAVDTSIWKVDFRNERNVTSSEVASISGAVLLNGMAVLDGAAGTILVGDSGLGVVWRVDIFTGTYAVVLKDQTMAALGINGLKTLRGYAYYTRNYTTSQDQLFCRVRIDHVSGEAAGPYEIIAEGFESDDFAISPHGVAYVAGSTANVVYRVQPNGSYEAITGNLYSSVPAGATSAAFGKTERDAGVLYVTTNGGLEAPVNGTDVEGAKVMAIEI